MGREIRKSKQKQIFQGVFVWSKGENEALEGKKWEKDFFVLNMEEITYLYADGRSSRKGNDNVEKEENCWSDILGWVSLEMRGWSLPEI